jgi:hypothetical protein
MWWTKTTDIFTYQTASHRLNFRCGGSWTGYGTSIPNGCNRSAASLPFDLMPWLAVLEESSVANNMVGAHL